MARRKLLIDQLPPTPCTPDMRRKIVEISDKEGVSIAEVVRNAISLFLSENVAKCNINVDKYTNPDIKLEQQVQQLKEQAS